MSRPSRLTLTSAAAVASAAVAVAAVPAPAMAMPAADADAVGRRSAGEPWVAGNRAPAGGSGGSGGSAEPRGQWPLAPRPPVSTFFDPPAERWGSGHRGVDLLGRTGQQVRSALAGTVTFAGRVAGMPVVVVDHGGSRTTYQPVSPTVSRGTEVAAGDVLGTLVWAGTHCSPAACLHWGWRRGDTYLDPLLLVGAAPRPVRLLPR